MTLRRKAAEQNSFARVVVVSVMADGILRSFGQPF